MQSSVKASELLVKDSCTNQEQRQTHFSSSKVLAENTMMYSTSSVEAKGHKEESPGFFKDLCMYRSEKGWEFDSNTGMKFYGNWSHPVALAHIDIKEIAEVYVALSKLKPKKGTFIHLFSDKVMVVLYLYKGEMTHSWPLWS